MSDDEVKPGYALNRAILGDEPGNALEVWGNVSQDVPMRITSAYTWLYVAGICDVSKFPERLAFRLAFLASYQHVQVCACVGARVCEGNVFHCFVFQ